MTTKEQTIAKVAAELGISAAEAAKIVDKVASDGWAWAAAASADQGTILCRCGAIATVRNRERFVPKCPACGRTWAIATVQ